MSSIWTEVINLIEARNRKIEAQDKQIAEQATQIGELTNLIKMIPTTAAPPSFTSNDRALLKMTSAALISQGALLTNMASLL